jgi:hypothetical protein
MNLKQIAEDLRKTVHKNMPRKTCAAKGLHKTRPAPRKTPETAILKAPWGDKEWTPTQIQ